MHKIFITFVILFSSSIDSRSYIDYESPYHPVVGNYGMVVSQNYLSSDIGIEILNKGGNAIDAAVAVGFSLAVTLPRAGNLGGGGFMLVYLKEKDEIFYIDYRSKSPLNSNLENIFNISSSDGKKYQVVPKNFDTNKFDVLDTGYKASAVPGTVAGLLDAHAYFGMVSYDLHKAIESTPRLFDDIESRRLYFKNDSAIEENSILKLPDLANTLSLISKHGKDGFYKGKTAKKIIQAMNDNGGLMKLEDFAQYKAEIRSPISTEYRGNKVFTAGPPSGGGITLLTALNILSFFELEKYKSNSIATYHLFSEALRRGHNNRSSEVGDPDYYDVPVDKLLSKERTKELVKSIKYNKASKASSIKPLSIINESRDTTHYSIIDSEGNAVSNTYTLGASFGSGVTIPGTGILMNNQMNNLMYRSGNVAIEGRGVSPGNRFKPGKRPMSTMAPVMVFDTNNNLSLITGSPGGSYIPGAILRVLTGVIDFNLSIGDATMLPRVHKDWPYTGIDYEKTLSSDIVKGLNRMGHKTSSNKTMGSTQSIHIVDGVRYGYADLRRPNASVSAQTTN
ncbi:MAG: gamma-glutamyltransferase family protein [Proteobacteria bacterium]|nr:gamma-glutamyltransferase family protein [Pseudomonadota bacterium]